MHKSPHDILNAPQEYICFNIEQGLQEIGLERWEILDEVRVQVCLTLGDVMWEPLIECKELQALDEYLDLHGVKRPCNLPCKTQ